MSILVNNDTKLIVQGFTGSQGLPVLPEQIRLGAGGHAVETIDGGQGLRHQQTVTAGYGQARLRRLLHQPSILLKMCIWFNLSLKALEI